MNPDADTVHQVSLHMDTPGEPSSLVVDGIDLSDVVTGVRIEGHGGQWATMHLRLMCTSQYRVDGRMRIEMDDATTEALVALGWTPPSPD